MNESPATPWDRTNERGSYAVLSGVLISALLGLSAFSVDVSLITMAQLQIQASADAASHAAIIGYRRSAGSTTTGASNAQWIVARNQVAMGTPNVDSIEFGRWDYTGNAFTVATTRINAARVGVSRKASNNNAVKLLLAPMLGVTQVDVSASSITAEQLRAIMLVMDMSCSMMTGNISATTSPVNVGRVSNIGFLDYLVANPVQGDLLGLSMFATYAVETPNATNPGGTPCCYTTIPTFSGDPPWLPLKYIETDQALIRQRINGICDTSVGTPTTSLCVAGAYKPTYSTVGSSTNPGPAMYQAINELTDTTKVNSTYFKAMVFFSDGWPNAGMGAAGGTNAANAAWSNDIYVWTILFANGGGDPAYMQSLVRGAPIAFAQTSQNVADLPAMYQTVAKSLPTSLVY